MTTMRQNGDFFIITIGQITPGKASMEFFGLVIAYPLCMEFQHDLDVLQRIATLIDQALDLDATLEAALEILAELRGLQRVTVTLYDENTRRLAISRSYGLTHEQRERGVYALDEGITGAIFRQRQPFVVPDISNEPLFLDKTGARRHLNEAVAFIGVPIFLHGEPMGVLSADRTNPQPEILEADARLLAIIATLLSRVVALHKNVQEKIRGLEQENILLRSRLSRERGGPRVVGKSQRMREVEELIARVAPTRATVLLLGESGTGKTLIARIIHDLSDRSQRPFVKVNCTAIPENLLEAELFGHEKGAFTGAATARPGRFEEAHGGTIFLDEIGELALPLQSKLLRVLQEREMERLGSNQTRKVDVRIISATNRELEQLVRQGTFRTDLYYRLNVFPIRVPALRERPEDILPLLAHFQHRMEQEYGRTLTLTPEALNVLETYPWPGNVREMENLVERLVILDNGIPITAERLRPLLQHDLQKLGPEPPSSHTPSSLQEVERRELLAALERCHWIQQDAARQLGITPRQMGYRIRKYGLEVLVAQRRTQARIHSGKNVDR
jgi:Nif-specific regulatory protein